MLDDVFNAVQTIAGFRYHDRILTTILDKLTCIIIIFRVREDSRMSVFSCYKFIQSSIRHPFYHSC